MASLHMSFDANSAGQNLGTFTLIDNDNNVYEGQTETRFVFNDCTMNSGAGTIGNIEHCGYISSGSTTYDLYNYKNNDGFFLRDPNNSSYYLTFYFENDSSNPVFPNKVTIYRNQSGSVSRTGTVLASLYYAMIVTGSAENEYSYRPCTAKGFIHSIAKGATSFIDPGTGETFTAGPSSVDDNSYQVWVTLSGSNENIATNGLLTRTYDGNPVICRVYDLEHEMFSNGLNYDWVVRDHDTQVIIGRSVGPILSLTDTTSAVDVSAFYEGALIGTVTITINPINIPVFLKNGVVFSKYYDDRDGEGTRVVVTSDMFNYGLSGVLPEDKIDNNTLLTTRLNVVPSATYTSAGSSTSTTTVGVNFSFGLTGSNARNYTVTPDSTLQGVTGTIFAKWNGKTADQNGYMMRILDMASGAFVSDSSVPFTQQGYDVFVSKGSNPSGLSNANYEFSWICDFTKNNETTRSLSSPNNENFCVDVGEYDVTVYVKGKTNSDDYSGGYAYVGQISLTILPVINVSWIAASYEG